MAEKKFQLLSYLLRRLYPVTGGVSYEIGVCRGGAKFTERQLVAAGLTQGMRSEVSLGRSMNSSFCMLSTSFSLLSDLVTLEKYQSTGWCHAKGKFDYRNWFVMAKLQF